MSSLPLVLVSSGDSVGFLNWEDGDTIEIGSQRWFEWLEEHGSFRFESGFAGEDSFTARKHNRKSGDFWYAYRKLGKGLCNKYLGKSEALTVVRMLDVAQKLSQLKPKLDKDNGYAKECITEKQQECHEVQEEVELLRSRLTQLQVQLEDQAAKDREWREMVAALQHENAQLRSQLTEVQGEIKFQDDRWRLTQKQNDGLTEELKKVKAKLEQANQSRPASKRKASKVVEGQTQLDFDATE